MDKLQERIERFLEECPAFDYIDPHPHALPLIREMQTRIKQQDTSKDKLVAALEEIRTYVLTAESDSNFAATREKLITRIKYLTQKGLEHSMNASIKPEQEDTSAQ